MKVKIVAHNKDLMASGKEKVVLTFKGLAEPLPIGSDKYRQVKAWLGDDPDQWVGRDLILRADPTVVFQGKKVGGIALALPQAAPPKVEPVPEPKPTLGSDSDSTGMTDLT